IEARERGDARRPAQRSRAGEPLSETARAPRQRRAPCAMREGVLEERRGVAVGRAATEVRADHQVGARELDGDILWMADPRPKADRDRDSDPGELRADEAAHTRQLRVARRQQDRTPPHAAGEPASGAEIRSVDLLVAVAGDRRWEEMR